MAASLDAGLSGVTLGVLCIYIFFGARTGYNTSFYALLQRLHTYAYIYLGIYHKGSAASVNERLKHIQTKPTGSSIICHARCLPGLEVGWWGTQPPTLGRIPP